MVRRELLVVRPVLNDYCIGGRAFFEVLSYNLGTLAKKEAEKQNWTVIDLPWCSANRESIDLFLAMYPEAELVVFLGHGHEEGDRAIGHGKLPVLDGCNIGCFKGKGLYFVCCHAGRVLGELALESGALFFVGFDGKLRLMSHRGELLTAHCTLFGLKMLLAGSPVGEAISSMRREHLMWIDRLKRDPHRSDPQLILTASTLGLNLEALTLWKSAGVEGGEMNQTTDNPERPALTPEERGRGLGIIRRWVADPSSIPDTPTDFEGTGDSWSLRKILDSLERGEYEEVPERFLRDVVESQPE